MFSELCDEQRSLRKGLSTERGRKFSAGKYQRIRAGGRLGPRRSRGERGEAFAERLRRRGPGADRRREFAGAGGGPHTLSGRAEHRSRRGVSRSCALPRAAGSGENGERKRLGARRGWRG